MRNDKKELDHTHAMVGAVGLRFPNRELRFDPAAGRFTNCPEANAFLQAPARGAFSMKDFA